MQFQDHYAGLSALPDGDDLTWTGTLRGMQDVLIPTVITFLAYWIIGFPVSYYLSMHTDFKSAGIWMGLFSGLTVSAILLYVRFAYLSKKMIRTQLNTP